MGLEVIGFYSFFSGFLTFFCRKLIRAFLKEHLPIYLAESGLSRGTQDLPLWHVDSLLVGQRFQSTWAVAGEPSRSVACGIPGCPDQGLNPSPLHSKVDSLPLGHQGSLY